MRYRLPLELELTALELAAPPLAIDSLHKRVAFFSKISLVHRSFTAWAQDRLRDQFLYTYRPRWDEHERLKTRFEAGFGRDRPLRRLYLDMSGLPDSIRDRREPGTDSVSATTNGGVYGCVSSNGDSSHLDDAVEGAQEQACEAVAHFVCEDEYDGGCWTICTMITDYSQALDTLWLKLPGWYLDIKNLPPPRLLYIDNAAFSSGWGWFQDLPLSSETVLAMRNIKLCAEGIERGYDTRHMIFHTCWWASSFVLNRFPRLETLVWFEPTNIGYDNLGAALNNLPTSVRGVHILERNYRNSVNQRDPPRVLPHLDSFTYTLLPGRAPQTPEDDGPAQDALAEVQQAVESIIVAPRCTFKYVQWMESPEEALANALAAFKLQLDSQPVLSPFRLASFNASICLQTL